MKFNFRPLALISACTLTLTGSLNLSAIAQNVYPDTVIQNFMRGCVNSATQRGLPEAIARTSCECMIRELQKKYTIEQFRNLVQRIRNSQNPPEMAEIVKSCTPRRN